MITGGGTSSKIPDMTGISLRDALEIASVLDIRVTAEGEGYVVSQKQVTKNGERLLQLTLSPEVQQTSEQDDAANTDESKVDTTNTQ